MRYLIRSLILALLFGALATPGVQAHVVTKLASMPPGAQLIPGQYIVTLSSHVAPRVFVAAQGISPQFMYDAALNGFTARLTDQQLAALQRHPDVALIEPDQRVTLDGDQVTIAAVPWNLDRIDQRYLPLSGSYTTHTTAATANAYIIDTGIQTSHPDFGGRAAVAYDALGGNGQDCNGSGTFTAGIVGGSAYGVAKGVRLWAVRVLDCNGAGSISGIIAGLNWVAGNHRTNAVASISAGGSLSTTFNTAVKNMINAGVATAVVAGASASNACNYSPGSVPEALTVAASDITDHVSSSSNYGSCIDLYAPGVNVTSDTLNGGTQTRSGTTAAAAHVAGVAALYKATFGDQPSATVHNWIVSSATSGVLSGVPPGTANRLLYTNGL